MAETSEGFRSVERPKTRERGSTDNVELTDIEENMADNASIEQGTVGQGQGRVGGRRSSRDCSKHEPAATSQDGAHVDVIEEHEPKMPSNQIDLAGDQSNLDASEVERPIVHFPQTDEVDGSGISEEPIAEVVSSKDHQTPDTNRADDTTSATTADDNETTTTSQPTEVANFSDAIYGDDMDYSCQTFNADDFSKKLAQLTDHFTTPALRGDIELSYPIPALQKLIKNAINCALVYKTYSMACKKSLTFLREQMRAVRNSIHTQVQMRHKQIMAVDPFLDLEEKELRAEASKLHAEVAKISAELAQALKFSTETETTATEAAEAAIKAAQEANRIQQELEAKRLAKKKKVPTATLR